MPSYSYVPPGPRARRWVERCLGDGAQVVKTARLTGGLTAYLDRVAVNNSRVNEVVLRRWPQGQEWAPGLIERESAGLSALSGSGLPAPSLLGADSTGEHSGSPALLMTALAGEPELNPTDIHAHVRELAGTLARIHSRSAPGLQPTDPYQPEPDADRSWIGDAGLARALLAAGAGVNSSESPVLVHGDFQPLNVLWRGDTISGIVDWTYTGRGQRAIDVGHCRLALAVIFSVEAAEEFLHSYESRTGHHVDPRQDIRALLMFSDSWHDYARLAVAGRARIDHDHMADRVTTVLRKALDRLHF